MTRLTIAALFVTLAFPLVGCDGENQPNPSAAPEQVNADFAKKTADMMKTANGNMDPKNAKKINAAKPAAPAEGDAPAEKK